MVSLGAGKQQTFTVRVQRIGFAPWFGKLDLTDTTAATITLPRLAQTLSPVEIHTGTEIKSPLQLTGFYDGWLMRQKGTLSAVFIGPEELEFRHPARITDMLYGLNGVSMIRGTPVSTRSASLRIGACPMAILVDGQQMYGSFAIDKNLDAADVMAIEVYNRGGNMPISLQANDNICGVIAFWTGSRKL
jgi:hypothetical protein